MQDTRNKLNEARFFLEKMSRNYRKSTFNYYLSAYISAARSVLWIMRSEYHDVEGWEGWYSAKEPNTNETLFLRKINDIRVRSEKVKPLTTDGVIGFMLPEDIITDEVKAFLEKNKGKKIEMMIDRSDPKVESAKLNEDNTLSVTGKLKAFRMIEDFPGEDVLDVCKRYCKLLESLVKECEKQFRHEQQELILRI